MKFTLGWLKEHLETEAPLDQICATLTRIGLEVEAVHDAAADLADFVVGYVIECKPHPNADKLSVCTVDTGEGETQVVCGAPNARTGMKGVFAPAGTTIPGTGLRLKKTKIRGVESSGMLCSAREMGLGEDHEGIIDLPDGAPVGAPFAPVLGLDDPVIEIGITPNRQDCLGVHGVARDLAAANIGALKDRDAAPVPGAFESPVSVRLAFENGTEPCPMFVGRYIRGVKNGPSPAWLQDRLRAIGLRPISALVDMTNFVTFDLGRPLHVFDADTLAGGIHVRLSRAGESIDALDGKSYTLDDSVTAIADDDGVLALGGIVGGEPSSCTEATKNVFIEAALFDPLRTAASGRHYNIESDARYRFERGVDPDAVCSGMEAATRLVLDLCGGEPSEMVVAGAVPDWRRTISLRASRVNNLVGLDLPADEVTAILERLGFAVEGAGETLKVSVPSWRRDAHGEADLVEEVARIHGYDRIPSVPLQSEYAVTRPALTRSQTRAGTAKRALAARGMDECVTWSFLASNHAALFGGGGANMHLANPISADLDCMRPSLLPNLIAAAGQNADRGFADTAFFEVGPQYADQSPEGQTTAATGIRAGNIVARQWDRASRAADVFDAKADALAALAACGAPVEKLQIGAGAPDWYHPGRSGTLQLGPKNAIACFGEIHPRVLRALDVAGPVVGFEVVLESIPLPKSKASRNRPPLVVSDLPGVDRDFAFVADNGVAAAAIVQAARTADKKLISVVSVFDVFAGESVGAGRKSIAITVRLQPVEQTLTDSEIDRVAEKIVAAVAKATGATLRG
ncbi:MAG TPA: phenylalanine--tRNA ligase subunit beta [Alphaproteobacteria bacterium]|nr:phenylalanine--tRNA ligase subunit beta [Alphaproteobacteria bacterium]